MEDTSSVPSAQADALEAISKITTCLGRNPRGLGPRTNAARDAVEVFLAAHGVADVEGAHPGTGVREYARILVSLVARPRTGSTGWNGTA